MQWSEKCSKEFNKGTDSLDMILGEPVKVEVSVDVGMYTLNSQNIK